MKPRSRLVWKLIAVVAVILTVAIALAGYAYNLVCAHYSLESARAFLRFNSESIVKGIGQQMMSRNNEGAEQLINEISRDSTVYRDIRLVSHHSGEVVASRSGGEATATLELQDRTCAVCHDRSDLGGDDPRTVDEVFDGPEGDRVLSVVAPILNEPGCGTADCHLNDPQILGFVNADYSLEPIDTMAADRRIRILLIALGALSVGIVALWFMFGQLLDKPISLLIGGTKRIAAGQLDFRFARKRSDEIGALEESFNAMMATVQTGQRELVQAQKFAAIGQAVTGIQHAIKNMLGALTGGAYLVRVGVAKDNRDRVEEGQEMVEEGIKRIGALSRSMLNYAKEWKAELQTADLNDLVQKICNANRQAAAEQGIDLRCELPEGASSVVCDPNLVHMAVTDILVNAFDACASKDHRRGDEVVLKNSSTDGGNIFVIEVRDNGCGMNEEVRRNVFTPFFSTKNTLGTGLGLALTARIINVHGGKITVESELDRGSVFRIHLPANGPKDHREPTHGQTSPYC